MAFVLRLSHTSWPRCWKLVPGAFHLQGEKLLGSAACVGKDFSEGKGSRHQPGLSPSSAAAPQCCSEDQACLEKGKKRKSFRKAGEKGILEKHCYLVLLVRHRRTELLLVTGVSHLPGSFPGFLHGPGWFALSQFLHISQFLLGLIPLSSHLRLPWQGRIGLQSPYALISIGLIKKN